MIKERECKVGGRLSVAMICNYAVLCKPRGTQGSPESQNLLINLILLYLIYIQLEENHKSFSPI